MTLTRGLYEALLTRRLRDELQRLDPALTAAFGRLESAEAADRLALHLARVVERVVERLGAHERVDAGTALVGDLILKAVSDTGVPLDSEIPLPGGAQLRQLAGRRPDGSVARIDEPVVPLLDTALMTNAPGEPRLGAQIVSEIPSADGIDLIMAFIRRSGLAPMRDAIRRHLEDGRPVRVLTTVYTASTEACALEELADLGARVRVSYDTTGTRLNAKAWIFHRGNGFNDVPPLLCPRRDTFGCASTLTGESGWHGRWSRLDDSRRLAGESLRKGHSGSKKQIDDCRISVASCAEGRRPTVQRALRERADVRGVRLQRRLTLGS